MVKKEKEVGDRCIRFFMVWLRLSLGNEWPHRHSGNGVVNGEGRMMRVDLMGRGGSTFWGEGWKSGAKH